MAVGDDKANGDTLTPTEWNGMEDDQLNRLHKDGSVTWTGDQDAGGQKLTSLGAPTASGDAARKDEVDGLTSSQGDLVTGDSSGNPTQLAIGANGKYLKSDGTDPGWADLPVASESQAGIVELATVAEVDGGSATDKAVTPDTLAGSNMGMRSVSVQLFDGATDVATGDGKAYFVVPAWLDGWNLVDAEAAVVTKSTSGTPTVQCARGRQASATSDFTYNDMLSTALTIDANEYHSKDAATAVAINTSYDDIAEGDIIRFDVDTAGTGTKGVIVTLTFQLP